ncbi:N-dimethylarginine dimethylaminohydrolase [Halovivax ruber XH-70]|uniref:N-dimethylarginine dimethylaminohydrolase n=1 Tax=Halovivax ruber (strain DSM 18193 / JCM 13892 / XH-70) TaxID=797302 RepID=L0I962_HALRX|nr:arginine deiminase-related protein [Halovivax ruber]AGB14776.1 N-dimethylarginine dimethylaminohydrolase [Halovivax ruber XH-70]
MTGATDRVVDEGESLPFTVSDCADRPGYDRILLVRPTHFDVTYEINPYMGGDVDRERAMAQWRALRDAYDRYADVAVLDPDDSWRRLDASGGETAATAEPARPTAHPDLVFAANLGVPTADGDGFVLASMATDERQGEPAYLETWATDAGYEVFDAPADTFEGTGDALWHPGARLLWGGYGVRTDRAVYDELAARLDTPVLALELTDDRYYHLDVCLTPLDAATALIQPEAFTADGLARLDEVFETLLEIPVAESHEGMAGNAHCVDGKHVLLPADNPETASILADAGYEPVPIETGEFEKAGGSVFCLSLEAGTPR